MHQDPVCGMTLEPSSAAGTYEHDGITYAFCSSHCLERFRTHPEQYLNTLGVPIAAGVLYPVFELLLNPMLANVAMTFSSVSVIGNALRLRRLPL